MMHRFVCGLALVITAVAACLAGSGYYMTFNAATEDHLDFGPLKDFDGAKSWALVERVKFPSSIGSGYQLARGMAWEDLAGDFLIIVGQKGMSAWVHSGGWRKIDVEHSLADDQWHLLCFQYRREQQRTELWLDGRMIGSLNGVAPPRAQNNGNHFVIGGQLAAANKRQGRLYLEQSSSLSHVALLQRALSAEEIKRYDGTMAATTKGLYLSTVISAATVVDAASSQRTITIGGNPQFSPLADVKPQRSCRRCAATPGFIVRTRLVREIVPCPQCEGNGTTECRMCRGKGVLRSGRPCRRCKGTGKDKCIRCRGKGGREKLVRKEVKIPCPRCNRAGVTQQTEPGGEPSSEPTPLPTPEPTAAPTEEPKPEPTPSPSADHGPSAIELAKQAFALMNASPPQLGKSIKLYEKAVALAPTNHVILHDLGIACFRAAQSGKRDKLAAAERHFRRAIALDEHYWRAYDSLGAVLGTAGRYDEAIASLSKAHRLAPKEASICRNLAFTYKMKYKRTKNKRDFAQERRWRALATRLARAATR